MPRVTLAFDKRSARSFDADGRMRVADCILSTAEVNPYRGQEIPNWEGLGLKPNHVYDLYRDPEELSKSVASFEGVPLMVKHIPQTAEEPRKEYIAGSVHGIKFDGKHLRGNLLVMDGYAIDLIESNQLSDLSCGYRYVPDMTSGKDGEARYDGVMRNIQGNHVALVDEGRASDAHVADAAFNPQGPNPTMQGATMPDPTAVDPNAAGVDPNAPPAGSPAGEQNEQANMAAIGQALKHIAGLLENIHAKVGGAAPAAAPVGAPPAVGAEPPGAKGGDPEDEEEQAEDFALEKGPKEGSFVNEGAEDNAPEQEGDYDVGNKGNQEGTPARGNTTPHGAMDAKTVKSLVATAVKAERDRAASVTKAQRDVRGVLGDVIGMDDAGAIYREALKQVGVDVAGIPAGTERAAWQAYTVVRSAAAGAQPRGENAHAMDAKATEQTQSVLLGHLAKISVKG